MNPHIEKLTFLTGNPGKLEGAQKVMGESLVAPSLDLDLPEIQSLDPIEVISAKIEEARKHIRGPLVVEDTSLFLRDWGDGSLPGPMIKFILQSVGLNGISELGRTFGNTAEALVMIGYYDPRTEDTSFFSASLHGKIPDTPRGDNGFGWDSVFEVNGKTFAEMINEEKASISMRTEAFAKLKRFLRGEQQLEDLEFPK